MYIKKSGFTLLELIVVITILAILGTIAFISLQGYNQSTRDSVRISDIANIKTSLGLFEINTGRYPQPDGGDDVVYSGVTVWTQGTIGDNMITNLLSLDKKPLDPLTNKGYTYSILNTEQEYEIGTILEGGDIASLNKMNETYAESTETATAYVTGNYNGMVAKVPDGDLIYVLAVPSIIGTEAGNLQDIIDNGKLIYNGYTNIPSNYSGTKFDINGESELILTNKLLVFTGTVEDLRDKDKQILLVENLQVAYNGTVISNTSEIKNIINTDTAGNTEGTKLIAQILIQYTIDKTMEVTALSSGEKISSVALGRGHTCAITIGGDLLCWGWNANGQLGDGTKINKILPTKILSGVAKVSAGFFHTCAITTGGDLKCWGRNGKGQIGDNTIIEKLIPTQILSGIISVDGGYDNTCAITTGNDLKCWGDNTTSALGDGTLIQRNLPTQILDGVLSVDSSGTHACAITTGNDLKCWGWNGVGQLGIGSTVYYKSTPTQVMSGISSVCSGSTHTCAITTGGDLKCWGRNQVGDVGDNTKTIRRSPVQILSGIASVSCFGSYTCAITNSGDLKCWGYNYYGQLGDGTSRTEGMKLVPTQIFSGVTKITAGEYHTCAISEGGYLKCWGYNGLGGLGDGTLINKLLPTQIIVN